MDKKHLEKTWINSILDNCENVGISKQIIHRFTEWYLVDKGDSNE